jgi:hypothetical protein
MPINSDNRRRAFADVVTVEAWHDDFKKGVSKVDLHADVVFGTARLGGEAESPIRFRLSIRRAEMVIIIPELEPVSVDKKSVSRDAPSIEGRLIEMIEESRDTSVTGDVSGTLNLVRAQAKLAARAGQKVKNNVTKKLKLSRNVSLMMVTQSISPEGYYRWLVESSADGVLEGRPWDPAKQPRLRLIDERADPSKGIPPTVRVEVRCRREDLVISDLKIKKEGLWAAVKSRAGHKNRMAAAVSYIRARLSEEDLEVQNIDDMFGQLTLGSAIARSS